MFGSNQCKMKTADWGLQTADCRPGVKCRLCVKCRLQTESKTQAGVKCRPSINCSHGRVKGQKNLANTCKQTLTWRHLLSQIHSFLLWNVVNGQPKNIIAILNRWTVRETSRFNFRCKVFDIRDQGPWIGTTPRCLRLNKSCWPKILYRKNYSDKKGSNNHSNNKERCSVGDLDDLPWKYCKSRYADSGFSIDF